TTVPFKANHVPGLIGSGYVTNTVLDSAQDLADSADFWTHLVVTPSQGKASADGDPFVEGIRSHLINTACTMYKVYNDYGWTSPTSNGTSSKPSFHPVQ